jgi:hypothetical protein
MDHIAGRLREITRDIEIVGADPITQHGFTQVPNVILTNHDLTVGAKLTYAMLLHYAWQNDRCFPGQDRLAQDMGAGKRSVIRFMAELERAGFVAVKRRGLGQTNLYQLFTVVRNAKTKQRRTA